MGVLLYEMFTGQSLDDPDTAGLVRRVIIEAPGRDLRPDLP
jgi:hypothetical protein